MKIRVTKKDIENGLAQNCFFCPVALVLKRKFPNKIIKVSNNNGGIEIGKMNLVCPKIVKDFVYAFDNNQQVDPFTVELHMTP